MATLLLFVELHCVFEAAKLTARGVLNKVLASSKRKVMAKSQKGSSNSAFCLPSPVHTRAVGPSLFLFSLTASCADVICCLQVLALAIAYQAVTSTHLMRPPINEVEPDILDDCLQYSRCGRPKNYNSSEARDLAYIAESG